PFLPAPEKLVRDPVGQLLVTLAQRLREPVVLQDGGPNGSQVQHGSHPISRCRASSLQARLALGKRPPELFPGGTRSLLPPWRVARPPVLVRQAAVLRQAARVVDPAVREESGGLSAVACLESVLGRAEVP